MEGAETDPIHTLIFSDVHLTTAEPDDPERPLWKRFKRADLFFDDKIERMLEHFTSQADGRLELILNGDVFDFDGVTDQPDPAVGLRANWLERQCGLGATEPKSAWKMSKILDHHPIIVRALRRWLAQGHRLVFICLLYTSPSPRDRG